MCRWRCVTDVPSPYRSRWPVDALRPRSNPPLPVHPAPTHPSDGERRSKPTQYTRRQELGLKVYIISPLNDTRFYPCKILNGGMDNFPRTSFVRKVWYLRWRDLYSILIIDRGMGCSTDLASTVRTVLVSLCRALCSVKGEPLIVYTLVSPLCLSGHLRK